MDDTSINASLATMVNHTDQTIDMVIVLTNPTGNQTIRLPFSPEQARAQAQTLLDNIERLHAGPAAKQDD